MPKFKLDFNDTDVDPLKVLGIVCDLQVLSLCAGLNKDLGLALKRSDKDLTQKDAQGTYHYAVYQHRKGPALFYLSASRSYHAVVGEEQNLSLFGASVSQEKPLVKSKESVSIYLWYFENEEDSQLYRNIVNEIKTLNYIKAVFELKSKQSLMLEEKLKDYHGI